MIIQIKRKLNMKKIEKYEDAMMKGERREDKGTESETRMKKPEI